MALQDLYVGDVCAYRDNTGRHRIGTVDATHGDPDSHRRHIDRDFYNGIDFHHSIPEETRPRFLHDGVPPRGTALILWPTLPGQHETPGTLAPVTDLDLIDRELFVGDTVSNALHHPGSGTVTRCDFKTTELLPPSVHRGPVRFIEVPKPNLQDIPVDELRPDVDYNMGQFVFYKGWLGVVENTFEDVAVRLDNGNIVIIEDSPDLQYCRLEEGPPLVGDHVAAPKSKLRHGRWVYGEYCANLDPVGVVVDLRVYSIGVRWLQQRPGRGGTLIEEMPPYELSREVLKTEAIYRYRKRSLNPQLGARVRFRDLVKARNKYPEKFDIVPTPGQTSSDLDLNVFTVVRTSTTVQVTWQDQTVETLQSTQVKHILDLGDEDEVWPGNVITTRKAREDSDDYTYIPERVGVVQRVSVKNRIASVRWFTGTVSFAGDDRTVLLPGSWTGALQGPEEDISLYDISCPHALSRSIGDFVTLVPYDDSSLERSGNPMYKEAIAAINAPLESRKWFGEVVRLGLDGLIHVRLGASIPVQEIVIPPEYTSEVLSLDEMNDLMEAVESDEDISTESGSGISHKGGEEEEVWFDEDGLALADALEDNDWQTDDGISDMDQDTPMIDAPATENSSPESTKPDQDIPSIFSYASMLAGMGKDKPEAFSILDGPVPPDHHYINRSPITMDGAKLRRISKEHRILQSSLPDGVFVRTWETGLDLLRILVLGPLETPYEYAPFVIDILLGESFPTRPPLAFFHSWTDGSGPVNPNLYEDGKVCLSLLGTWPGDDQMESWSPKSTILQLMVSLLGLVLVKEPYFNEAGFESRAGTAESEYPSALYSERTYLKTRLFIIHVLSHPILGFEHDIEQLYHGQGTGGPCLLARAIWSSIDVVHRSQNDANGGVDNASGQSRDTKVSVGALIPLRRHIEGLLGCMSKKDEKLTQGLRKLLNDPRHELSSDALEA